MVGSSDMKDGDPICSSTVRIDSIVLLNMGFRKACRSAMVYPSVCKSLNCFRRVDFPELGSPAESIKSLLCTSGRSVGSASLDLCHK